MILIRTELADPRPFFFFFAVQHLSDREHDRAGGADVPEGGGGRAERLDGVRDVRGGEGALGGGHGATAGGLGEAAGAAQSPAQVQEAGKRVHVAVAENLF